MIQVEELSFGFTAKDLYKDISFTLEAGQHCALIGSNGTGKSTLAEILIHPEEYLYDGKIVQPANKKSRVNYGILKVLYRSKTRYQNKTARNVGLKKDIK